MKIHNLKLRSEYWADVMGGYKKAELRENDRGFKANDLIHFIEVNKNGTSCDDGSNLFLITYVYEGTGEFGLEKGYCILSIERLQKPETDDE